MELSIEAVRKVVPNTLKNSITQDMIDKLNNLQEDPTTANFIRENYIGYTSVLKNGNFKAEDYLNAVMYVSYKLMGNTNLDAYVKVFPQRYLNAKAKGYPDKDINSAISAYNRGKLVNLIMEQTLIPTYVLNQDIYQEAINTQANLMRSARSEIVRCKAAECLINHLAKPELKGPLVNIEINQNKEIQELETTLADLAKTQLKLIQSGVNTKTIAEQNIITVEPEEN